MKKPQTIPPAEIHQGVLDAIREYAGVTEDDAVQYISRKLGFQKAGAQLRDRIVSVIDEMVEARAIKRIQNRLDIV